MIRSTWFIVIVTTLFYLGLVALVDVVMTAYLGPVIGHTVSTFAAIVLCPFWLAAMAIQGGPG